MLEIVGAFMAWVYIIYLNGVVVVKADIACKSEKMRLTLFVTDVLLIIHISYLTAQKVGEMLEVMLSLTVTIITAAPVLVGYLTLKYISRKLTRCESQFLRVYELVVSIAIILMVMMQILFGGVS